MKAFLHHLLDEVNLGFPRDRRTSAVATGQYLVFRSECPPLPESSTPNVIGATSRKLDLVLMGWLKDRGEWHGRRPLIWIDDMALSGIAEKEAYDPRLCFAAVALHENAHVAEATVDLSMPVEALRQPIVALAAYAERTRQSLVVPPFFQHGWKFVRACSHLQHRAKTLGYEIPSHWIFDGDCYELPGLDAFTSRLDGGYEPQNLLSIPMHQINSFRASDSFARLWQQSIRAWLEKQTQYTSACSVAIDMLDVTPDEIE